MEESKKNDGFNEQEPEKLIKVDSFKCAKCGSVLEFDPSSQKLKCTHCDYIEDFSQSGNVIELAFTSDLMSKPQWSEDVTMFVCQNCGAKEILDNNETAAFCPFCGTSHIVKSSEIVGLKPNAVIPFTLTKAQMLIKVKAWARSKFFAPKSFKKELEIENINGVYAPCFTFDSDTCSSYEGVLGEYYTVSVGSGKNRRTVTKTRYYNVGGGYDQIFDDILIEAGPILDQKTITKLNPFDKIAGRVYDKAYLSGFMANHYDREVKDCFREATGVMDANIRRNILNKYHADVVSSLNVKTNYINVTYKYLLLPVYVGNSKFKSKVYNFFANGNTGKITGKTPVSPGKVSIATVSLLAFIALIIFLVMLNLR